MRTAIVLCGCTVLLVAIVGVSALAQPPGDSEAQREVARLQRAVKDVNQVTDAVGKRLPPLDAEVEKLRKKVKEIEPPKFQPPPVEKVDVKPVEPPRQVGGPTTTPSPKKKDEVPEEWHLPLSRESDKKTNLLIVCDGGKVYLADFEALTDAVNKDKGAILRNNGTYFLARGDFNVVVTPTEIKCALKAGRTGETVEKAKTPGSALMERFKALSPKENVMQFCVYPDSYEAFQAVRQLAYDRKYDVGWMPVSVGKPILIGGGKASSQ